MAGDNVELKATIKSDSAQAQDDVKKFGTSLDDAGKKAKDAGKAVSEAGEKIEETGEKTQDAGGQLDAFTEHLKKMSGRELAEKILSVATNLDKVGDVLTGLAENDAAKFASGMDAAVRATVTVVGTVAPQFAPVVAIVGTVITRFAEWAFSMKDAAQASKELEDQIKSQNAAIEHAAELAKLDAQSHAEELEIAIKAKEDELKILHDKMEQELTDTDKFNADKLERDKLWGEKEILEKQLENARMAEARAEEKKNRLDGESETEKESREIWEKGLDARVQTQKDAAKESAKTEAEWAQDAVENSKLAAAGMKKYADDTARAKQEADRKATQSAKDAAKAQADAAKKSAEDQKKAAEDAQKRVTASYQKMASIVSGLMTDWKGTISRLLDEMVSKWIDSMAKEAVATEESASRTISASTEQAGRFAGATASVTASNAERIRGGILGFFAPLGPFGEALAVGLIQVFMSLLHKQFGFAEGGRVQDRVPGLGRGDTIGANLGAGESVLNERATATLGPALIEALNRGGQMPSATAAAAPNITVKVMLSPDWDKAPPDRQLTRLLMNSMNTEVRRFNGELEASHFRDS